MDSDKDDNYDEAQRYVFQALEALKAGYFDKATKLALKADELYADPQLMTFIRMVEERKRAVLQSKNPQSTSEDFTYTDEQFKLVESIFRSRNYYDVLNVPRSATCVNIKRAYKNLAFKIHPDKNHAPGAVNAFKKVAKAYSVLSDVHERKIYDATLHVSRRYSNGTDYVVNYAYFNWTEQMEKQRRKRICIYILCFIFLLTISLFGGALFKRRPIYKVLPSAEYHIRHETPQLRLPYYVKDNLDDIEHSVIKEAETNFEHEFILKLKKACDVETAAREAKIKRATENCDRKRLIAARKEQLPACIALFRATLRRYTLF